MIQVPQLNIDNFHSWWLNFHCKQRDNLCTQYATDHDRIKQAPNSWNSDRSRPQKRDFVRHRHHPKWGVAWKGNSRGGLRSSDQGYLSPFNHYDIPIFSLCLFANDSGKETLSSNISYLGVCRLYGGGMREKLFTPGMKTIMLVILSLKRRFGTVAF